MSMKHRSSHPAILRVAIPRAVLAAILSVACVFSMGIDVPLVSATPAATPAATKVKKQKKDPALKDLPITELTPDEAILHALNRLAYGPRPGDIEHIRQMGLAKWIDQQLNPSTIDDSLLEARLGDYPTLKMSSAKLIEEYPRPKQEQKQASKRAEAQLQQDDQRRSDAAAAVISRDMIPSSSSAQSTPAEANPNPASAQADAADTSGNAIANADANAPSPMKEDSPQEAPVVKAKGKRQLAGDDPNNPGRGQGENSRRPQRVVAELSMAKVTRAIYSQRQLQQVMDDFWFNHF
ncbi:MAG: DUF1800 family protein, partial [Candidatus Acidiferrum sp.]